MVYRKSSLTPAKKKFAAVYARTDNGSEAVRQAYPELITTESTIRNKASRLLTNANVSMEIEYQKGKLEELASRAVDRVEKLIDSEDEDVATRNIWNTIHQVQGKPTQKIESTTTGVTLVIDLTSSLSTEQSS